MWKMALLALVSVMACAFAPISHPQGDGTGSRGLIQASSETLVPLERVYARLRKENGGEPLDAKLLRPGPGVVLYEIQWLTDDGRKLVFTVNARDGFTVATRGGR
jgi:uncharacterized membrane protein YkoI